MSNRLLQFVVFAFSILIAVYFGFFQPKDETQNSREIFQKRKIPIDQSRKPAGVTKVDKGNRGVLPTDPPIGALKPALNINEITEKYGSSYEYSRDEKGLVIRVKKTGEDARGLRRFSPSRYTDLVSRGDEIIRDFRGILGLDPSLPLGNPAVMTGEETGQVTYTQTLNGNRIEPWGKISILLNRDGSIESLQSSALRDAKVLNSFPHEKKILGSRSIAWVEQLEPVPLLRHAEETRLRGIQRVYDSESGELLFERDRRDRNLMRSNIVR